MTGKAVLINQTLAPPAGPLRLAGLPLLLRAVLAAQRAGVHDLLILGGSHPGPLLEHDPQVRLRWRWVPDPEADSGNEVQALLGVVEELKENFILLFADSIFEPQALAALRAARLEGKAARAAVSPGTTDGLPHASLYLCAPDFLPLLKEAPTGGSTRNRIGTVASQLSRAGSRVDTVEVSGRVWERTTEVGRLQGIQRDLTHFSLKPSDGFYAKFNKMVLSEPLIRLFLRTPATPNLITGMGLVLALASGVAFAQGGYWWGVGGAGLAFLSSLMDHCDGMVARLKFQESDFGTWFEMAVDYASTFAVFIGMAVGLYRETGFGHHLVVGGLFVLGAVMSFITMSRQRKRISGDNPADYANRMHRKLEENSNNLFHWFARKTYFVGRRAVLPYYILLFSLLDLRVLLLGWTTLGANIIWILTLHSNRLLRPAVDKAAAEAD
jgi:CDP-L-myo-inositol myo-inositolphosphotransferase